MTKIYSLIISMLLMSLFYNVKAQVPGCTTNISPANTSTNVNPYPTVTLKWNAVTGATSYDIYMSTKIPPKQLIGTSTSDTFNFSNAAYNTIYYWYVVPRNADGSAMGCTSSSTSFITSSPPPPPSNDDCPGAINISSMPLAGTTLGATQSQPAVFCGYTGTADDDVWYQYTPVTTGTIIISMTGNNSFDGVLEVFSGACGSLTSLTCSDSSQLGGREQITLNVTAGTTYKIRVYSFGSDLSSRGTFSISVTAVVLPVSLLNFKGERRANKNLLNWSTATELNNKGFEIQYSSNGNNFDALSFVNSKALNGNNASILNYEFTDGRTLSGNAYYRLKQVDKDGNSTFSNIILLKGDKITAIALSNIYPNPAKNKLNVTIASPASNRITLEIRDLTGKIVRLQAASVFNGDNNLLIDVAGLPSGSYFIKAVGKNGIQTSVGKFVKE
ncbi:MAG: T9SS type A sorting domain-containing protein [Bacteroidota bacterium]|nr:T9SS type A sorting domain-containing protein [Bacteroidota bacterium]